MLGTLNQNLARAEKQISDWNHHFLQLFCDTLPDEVADQVRHTFLELVYPPVHPDPSSVAEVAQDLSDELGEDVMAALLDLLAVNKTQRDSINESMRRQFMHWRVDFTQTRSYRLDTLQQYESEMKNLDRQRRSVAEQTLRQLRETLSDSAWLAIEDRVAEIESRLATANLNVDPALARGIN